MHYVPNKTRFPLLPANSPGRRISRGIHKILYPDSDFQTITPLPQPIAQSDGAI